MLISVFSKSGRTINTNFKHHSQIFVAICCIANTITLSNIHVRFIALNLGTPTGFGKRTFFHHLVVKLHYNPSAISIGVCLYSVYGKTFGLVKETLAEFHSCVLEMSPFFEILYIFCVTRGHIISMLARRVGSKSDSFKNYMEKIQNVLKWCML